jgi:hypothetical protein
MLLPTGLCAGGSITSGLSNAAHDLQKPTCAKGDPVVWLDTKLNVYFPETSPYYGKTYHGEWNCMSDAVKTGARLTKYVTSTSPAPAAAVSASPTP